MQQINAENFLKFPKLEPPTANWEKSDLCDGMANRWRDCREK
jgi:hypothetical protein